MNGEAHRSDGPSFDEFWLGYLRAHSRRLTRQIHYAGITAVHIGAVLAILYGNWLFLAAGAAIGGIAAWAAHYTVQGNDPVMFKGLKWLGWSLASGFRMYYLGIFFRLKPELRRAGVKIG